MLDLLAIIRDALLHPTQLLLRMHQQQYRYRQVLLAMALWLGFWWLVIGISVLFTYQIPILTIVAWLILDFLLIMMISCGLMLLDTADSLQSKFTDGLYVKEPVFLKASYYLAWPIRMQIAWFPTIFGLTIPMLRYVNSTDWRIIAFFLGLIGCLTGSVLITAYVSIRTALTTRILLSLMIFWMMLGSLPTFGTIWFSIVFFLAGLWIGIVRPLSWLWQSSLSLAVAGLLRIAREPWRWWQYHPALYDELALLPLAGLRWSLRYLYQLDPDRGFKALIAVYRLSAQCPTVRRTIKGLLHDPRYSASLFWQLGSDPQGIILLRQLNRHWCCLHPLIKPMTACTQIEEPQAWPAQIITIQSALAAYSTNPAFQQLSVCLQVISTILASSEAQPAYTALTTYQAEPYSLLERAMSELQANYQRAPNQPLLVPATGSLLTGWPRHVLLSTIEQLNFLQILAKQQG